MKRIFIAADISEAARQKAAAYIDELRSAFPRLRVGWERPEKLHLTLKFLGEVNDGQLEEVRKLVSVVAEKNDRFRMTLGGTGRFPQKGDARILWLGVNDQGRSAAVVAEIEDHLAELGFGKEKRPFRPHLTIARLREPRLSAELTARHLENDFEPVAFEVGEIVIYESKLQQSGSIYSAVTRCPLNGS